MKNSNFQVSQEGKRENSRTSAGNPVDSNSTPMWRVLFLRPVIRWGIWGSETLSNLSRATQLSRRTGTWCRSDTQVSTACPPVGKKSPGNKPGTFQVTFLLNFKEASSAILFLRLENQDYEILNMLKHCHSQFSPGTEIGPVRFPTLHKVEASSQEAWKLNTFWSNQREETYLGLTTDPNHSETSKLSLEKLKIF